MGATTYEAPLTRLVLSVPPTHRQIKMSSNTFFEKKRVCKIAYSYDTATKAGAKETTITEHTIEPTNRGHCPSPRITPLDSTFRAC